ncbi:MULTISPECIES: hypothetical protein [unclassified Oceanispirochaeta]|uniref:hypothetical protein n=1 Tax=unclassified Oceanispirochaeta TaxID=2635722 RepID=UPI000E09BC54|nr:MULTISPECIES: hypothetical protein [unclassified Oceanispirochaeta]MBF9017610.1 hypothetical protein [Oceanispirochaeta sp. M2]NPD74182.1 hypothetical protein [Oceanispirochaeta sp. M1]RDG29995.1 hypothetical protein DV872_18960 [Oceanispirochaeta sp. M1]
MKDIRSLVNLFKRGRLLKQVFLVTFIVLTFSSGCQNNPEPKKIFFFYIELCPNCESYKTAADISSKITVLSAKNTQIVGHSYNLINEDDAGYMMKIIREKNLDSIFSSLPILIVDDTVFTGYESILEKIIELKILSENQ